VTIGEQKQDAEEYGDLPDDLRGQLAGRDLKGRKLSGLSFRGLDLSGVQLEGALLVGADLRDCGLSSANLSRANLTKALLDGADLSGADLTGAELSQARLRGAVLERTILHQTVLQGSEAQNSSWKEADIRGGDWSGIRLSGAGFHRVQLVDVNLKSARLDGVQIDDSDIVRVRLESAVMSGVRVVDSTLEDVDFRESTLEEAQLCFANFERVDFRGAALANVEFESVAFRACRFEDVEAKSASFVRCSGLRISTLDRLRSAGADVTLPLVLRLWRALAGVRGGRLALAVLLIGLVAMLGHRVYVRLSEAPESDAEAEFLLEVDEATRQEWLALRERYENEPDSRHEILVEMSKRFERLGFNEEAEQRLRDAVLQVPLSDEYKPVRFELQKLLAGLLIRQGNFPAAKMVAEELIAQVDDPKAMAAGREILSEALLGEGQELIASKEYDLAFDGARLLIDSASWPEQQAFGYLLMAQARLGMGDPEGALRELAVLTAHFGRSPDGSVPLRMETAKLLVELGEVSAALALLQGLAESLPAEQRAEAELLRANIFMASGNRAMAIRTYEGMLERYQDFPLICGQARQARQSALKAGPDPGTERMQLEVLSQEVDPELALEGLLGLARMELKSEDPQKAVARYEGILERYADRPDLTFSVTLELASLYLSQGATSEAVLVLEAAERSSDVAERTIELRESLADVWLGAGQYGKAREILQRTLQEHAEEPSYVARTQLQIAGVLDRAGEVEEAQGLYRRVALADLDPLMSAAGFFGEATLLRRIGRPSEALPLMDQALVAIPDRSSFRGIVAVERAELLVELGRGSVGEIESMLAEARDVGFDLDQPRAFAELLLLLAAEMQEEGRGEDALRIYQRVGDSGEAAADLPLRQASLEGQVAALVALGRKEQAATLLDEAQKGDVNGSDADDRCAARMGVARGRSETGDVEKMVAEFGDILESCGSARFLVENLSVMSDLLVEAGVREKAVELLSATRDRADTPTGRQSAELELGRLGSVEDLEASSNGPDPALASLARVAQADLFASEGRLAEAEPLWAQVIGDPGVEPVPRSLALLGLAQLEMARGRGEIARSHLTQLRELSSDSWILEQADDIEGRMASAEAEGRAAPEPE